MANNLFQTRWLVLLALVVILFGGIYLLRQDTPTENTNNTEISASQASFQGISFNYAQVAETVLGQIIPAQPFTEPQPGGSGNPEYIQFTFDSVEGEGIYPPNAKVMLIYPTNQYTSWLEANTFDVTQWGPSALRSILDAQSNTPGRIPVAPVPTGSQVYQAQVTYPSFSNGTGVRFITSYAQDVSPITSQNLLYSYQGLTNDGAYWVSLFFPITTSVLPDTSDEVLGAETYDQFAANYPAYIDELTTTLNNAQPSDFTPNLDDLDAMVQSLSIPVGDIFVENAQ